MIVAYTSVNLHLEHYKFYHSATQRTNVSFIVHEKKLDARPVGFLKVSPQYPVCPLVVGCCKIALVKTSFFG